MHDYGSGGTNISLIQDTLHGEEYSTKPTSSPEELASEMPWKYRNFCRMDRLDGLNVVSSSLCEVNGSSDLEERDEGIHKRAARKLTGLDKNDRSANSVELPISYVLNGIMNGDVTSQYLRWLQLTPEDGHLEVDLGIAFWIGRTVGVIDSEMWALYAARIYILSEAGKSEDFLLEASDGPRLSTLRAAVVLK